MDNLYTMIISAKNKDENSLMKILNKFDPLIKKYARKLNYDDAKSELIVTLIETVLFMPIADKQYLQKDECIVGYISKSIKNKYIYLSKKKSKIEGIETELNLDTCTDKYYISADNSLLIKNLLDNLSDLQRDIIIQRFFLQYSDVEIASRLCISRQAINRIKNRALKNMKKYINY